MNISLIAGGCVGAAVIVGVVAVRSWWRRGRAARRGKQGERQVAKAISKLKKKDFTCLNDVLLPSSSRNTSQIDHIIVSTRGIFVLETKSHVGRITGSEHAQYWEQRLPGQSRSFYNPLLQNHSHLKTLQKLFPSIPEDTFVSVVVFTEASGLSIRADKIVIERRLLPDKIIERTLVPSERVEKKWWRRNKEVRLDDSKIVILLDDLIEEVKRRKKILSRDEIKEIAERIEEISIQDRQSRKDHTTYAKATAKNISREIRNGICPRCGGRLVVRKTDNGEFLGCENFPHCRFSSQLE